MLKSVAIISKKSHSECDCDYENCAIIAPLAISNGAKTVMSSSSELLASIKASDHGITLADLLTQHANIARRTAQRQIARLIESGQVIARGQGRARIYTGTDVQSVVDIKTKRENAFPSFIPVSADSQDILSYINKPLEAQTPVGYQREFLESYLPNKTSRASDPLGVN